MNTPGKEELIVLKMQKAEDALRSAKVLLDDGFLNGAVNRIYYSCYYAATALLFKKDIFTKSHTGVQQMLGLHFIKTNIIEKKHGQFYSILFNSRQMADYDDFPDIEIEDVKELYLSAREFLTISSAILNS